MRWQCSDPGLPLLPLGKLLAVDLGIRTGLALYGRDGRLLLHRSRNFGSLVRLKSGIRAILTATPDIEYGVVEGGGVLADAWGREFSRRGIPVRQVFAEEWRGRILFAREQRDGQTAKRCAGMLARRVMSWSGVPQPKSLQDDAAEAILVGLWGVLELGWLVRMPEVLRKGFS